MATLQNDAARATFGVTFVFSILAFGATCARFYARTLQKAGFGPDDWVILTALVSLASTSVVALGYGMAHRIYLGGLARYEYDD